MEHRNTRDKPFFDILESSSNPSSNMAEHTYTRGENEDHVFDGDDEAPSFDYQPCSTNSATKSKTSSSRHEGCSTHRQPATSTVKSKEEPSELLSSTSWNEIDIDAYQEAVSTAVERSLKKYVDDLLRALEGMSGRLSQLESVTRGLEHSVQEIRVSIANNHGEADGILRTLTDRMSEVHRTVQLLRDKREIAETHAELVKLQHPKGDGSGKNANGEYAGDQLQSDTTSVAQQLEQQHRVPSVPLLPALQQHASLLQVQDSILQRQPATTKIEPSTETNIQQQTSMSLSFNSSTRQLESQYAVQMQESRPLQLQASQASLPQSQILQSVPQHMQAVSQHIPVQQSLPQQAQIQQLMPQTQQLMPHYAQILQPPLQQSQIQRPLPQQGQIRQPMPQNVQIRQPLAHQLQFQQPMLQQVQIQQPPSQQGQVGQQAQMQQPLLHAFHSQQSISAQLQQIPPHVQPMQQLSASLLQMQQILGARTLQLHEQSTVQSPFQQYTHQPVGHSYGSLLQSQKLSLPVSYSAEQTPYASGNYTVLQQRLLPQSGPLTPQQQHIGSQASESFIQKSSLSLPLAYPTYDSSGMVPHGGYDSSMYRVSQPISAFHSGYAHFPFAQPVFNGSASSLFSQAADISGSGDCLMNRASIDELIEKVAAMGFSRDQVNSMVQKLTEHGESVDLNVVLDKLMNGHTEHQFQRSWYNQ